MPTITSIVGTFRVGQSLVGSWTVPAVFPSTGVWSVCGGPICGDGHVCFGVSTQFGVPTATVALPIVHPGGVPSAQAFGAVAIRASIQTPVGGVGSAQSFGALSVKSVVVVLLSGVGSAQAFGAPSVRSSITVTVGAIPSAQAFGIPTIFVGPVRVSPGGVPSAQAFGTLTIKTTVKVAIGGVGSAQAFGLLGFALRVPIGGVGSAQAFGAIITRTGFTKAVGGVPSAQAFGTVKPAVVVAVGGVPSAQLFGITRFNLTCSVPNVHSAQAFGTPLAYVVWAHPIVPADCIDLDLETIPCDDLDLEEAVCLTDENGPICDNPTICGVGWICGGSLTYLDLLDCLEDSGVKAIVNKFRVGDGTLVGEQEITYLDPEPSPLVLALEPMGCQ